MMQRFIWVAFMAGVLSACGGSSSDDLRPAPGPHAQPTPETKPRPEGRDVISGQVYKIAVAQSAPQGVNKTWVMPPTAADKIKIQKIIQETNRLRAEHGLPPLSVDDDLSAYAKERAKEVSVKFRHERFNDVLAVDNPYFEGGGISGENMAGSNNKDAHGIVHQLWRKSPTHYQNILHRDYQRIGVGYYYDPYRQAGFWVQLFAGGQRYSSYRFSDKAKESVNPSEVHHRAGHHFKDNGSSSKRIALSHGYVLEMEDGRSYGLKHHNVGTVLDGQRAVSYVHVGHRFVPDERADFVAHYRGKAIANHGNERVRADVEAQVDFRHGKRFMDLQVKHSRPELSFNERLRYVGQGVFDGGKPDNQALFYGDAAAELGGRFSRNVQNQEYRGAYGLKKQ